MNRFMKKFKAVYCNASFIFAIAVLMVTISLCIFYPDSVNASQSPSPSGDISTNDVTNDLDDVKSLDSGDKDLADATSDSTNGLSYITTMSQALCPHLSGCFWCLQYYL